MFDHDTGHEHVSTVATNSSTSAMHNMQPTGHQQSSSSSSWPYSLSRTGQHNPITAHRPIGAFCPPSADTGAVRTDRQVSIFNNLPQYETERRQGTFSPRGTPVGRGHPASRGRAQTRGGSPPVSRGRSASRGGAQIRGGSPRGNPMRLTANPFDSEPLALKFTVNILPFAVRICLPSTLTVTQFNL